MASHTGVVVTESGTGGTDGGLSGATRGAPRDVTAPATPAVGAPGADGQSGAIGSPAPASGSFGDLYLGSFPAMVRLARVLVDSPETAEDLVQDAFVHLHRHWGGVQDPRAYLHRSVVNACRSHHRRAWRERSRPSRHDGVPGPVGTAGLDEARGDVVDGAAEQGRSDDADVLGAALATLPYRQRAALVLRYYSDLPDAEIAVALGCRPGTVASLVHRGLERLREVVDHE
jgi:RNA polymerase sigma factor (sigma-70 family)